MCMHVRVLALECKLCWWRISWTGGRGRVDGCRRGGNAGVSMHVCVLALGCE